MRKRPWTRRRRNMADMRLGDSEKADPSTFWEVMAGAGRANSEGQSYLRVPLGRDCMKLAREKWAAFASSLDATEEVAASTAFDDRLEGVGVRRRVWKPGCVSSEEGGEVEVGGQSDPPITTVVRERQPASVKTTEFGRTCRPWYDCGYINQGFQSQIARTR
jgi:hypothetical protein